MVHGEGEELFAFDGGCAETFAAEQGSHRLLGQRRLKGVELLHEVLAGLAGLVEQGLQAGLIPAEPWPVGLLLDPGGASLRFSRRALHQQQGQTRNPGKGSVAADHQGLRAELKATG